MDKEKRAALAEEAAQNAEIYDKEYGGCPQCVLTAVDDVLELGISDETIQAAHALAGGGGLLGEGTCGALAGGLMAISAKHGRPPDDFGVKRHLKSYMLGRKLVEWFVEQHGGLTCHHVQRRYTNRTWNLWDAEEYQEFHESPCHEKCAEISGAVARWVVENI